MSGYVFNLPSTQIFFNKSVLRVCAAMFVLALATACSGTGDFGKGSGAPGQYKVGEPYEIDGVQYVPREDFRYSETGIASWYGPGFDGKRTANGETFDAGELTAAHRTLPMPSLARVTNLDNGKSVVVRINDRGPFANNRIIDVSQRAAELLGFAGVGTAKVRVDIMERESRAIADAAKKRGLIAPSRTQLASASEFIMPKAELQAGEPVPETASLDNVEAVPLEPALEPVQSAALSPPPAMIQPVIVQGKTINVAQEMAKKQSPLSKQGNKVLLKQNVGAPIPLIKEPKLASVPGHVVQGRFYPAPQVKQVKVSGKQHIYIQAGAFAQKDNAARLKQNLSKIAKANVSEISVKGKKLFRVRLGPLKDVKEADRVLAKVLPQSDKARITVE